MARSRTSFDVQLVSTLANRLFQHRLWRCRWQHHSDGFLGHASPRYNSAQAKSHECQPGTGSLWRSRSNRVSPAAHAPLRSGGSRSSWPNLHLSRSCGRPQFVLRPIQERIAGSSLSLGKPFTAADFSVQRGWRGMGKARSPLAGEMCAPKSYCIFNCIVSPKHTQTAPNEGHSGHPKSCETSHGSGIRRI
jgi:hypothetical protein